MTMISTKVDEHAEGVAAQKARLRKAGVTNIYCPL